jgi:spoIIIJ-associated protein
MVKRTGQQSGESEGIVEESLTIQQQGEAGTDFLSGLIRQFGLEAEVRWNQIDDETVEVTAVGDDLGLLVGPRGATLSAVQDLTRTFVQRQSENRTDRILVDVGGYREKRIAALRRFTEGLVDEVKESGSERALEPMNAADRKVVHDSVNEMEGVRTRSEGEDPSRYVVIEPAP